MGRKRNQGKARRAAKAKAKQEAEERDKQTNVNRQQTLAAQLPQSEIGNSASGDECKHGCDPSSFTDMNESDNFFRFFWTFYESYNTAVLAIDGTEFLVRRRRSCLIAAANATLDEFADVWNDLAKMKLTMSYFLCSGTKSILDGRYYAAREAAIIARYFDQHIAVRFKKKQALLHWHKNFISDAHTLVKFFRHRIPCSCLDEKYEEVKHIPKMGVCFNAQCKVGDGHVERSKLMYCSRCRCAVYCSRECQVANFTNHKPLCDQRYDIITKFEERQDS